MLTDVLPKYSSAVSHLVVITPFLPLVLHPQSRHSPPKTMFFPFHPHISLPLSQHFFGALHPDPVLPVSCQTTWGCQRSLPTQSLQTRSPICMESLQISLSHPGSAAGLTRDRILWDSNCNSSKPALGMNEFSLLQNLRNLAWQKIITSSTDPPISLVPALQNSSSKESKDEQLKFLDFYFSSQHCC